MKREKEKKISGSTETSCENQDIDHFLDLHNHKAVQS